MQACVDFQIKQLIDNLPTSTAPIDIIFTSDHGEYGGSHNLHAKGGALYEESINVPLYISFPSFRSAYTGTSLTVTREFVCSSVDFLPLLYELALGNGSWRTNSCDLVNYLSGRESIFSAIFNPNTTQLRIVPPGNGALSGLPYALHTTDEFGCVSTPNATHAIAFRVNGSGKLGLYSQWNLSATMNPTHPVALSTQYEFYDYTSPYTNSSEVGNNYLTSSNAALFVAAFGDTAVQNELYLVPSQSYISSAYSAALVNYQNYISATGCSTDQFEV